MAVAAVASRSVILAIAGVAAVITLLSGCATTSGSAQPTANSSPKPAGESSGSPSPHPAATPSGPGPLPADALFRITATATGADGGIADLVETVYRPLAPTPGDTALMTAQCPASGWPQNYPNPVYIHSTVSTKLHSGSKAWTEYSPVGVGVNLGNLSAWTGQFTVAPSVGCGAPSPLIIPGTAAGTAPASPASNPAGDTGGSGWYNGIYGFSTTYDGDDSPPAGVVVLSNCAIQVSALAKAANPAVAAWSGQSQQYPGQACWFGATS